MCKYKLEVCLSRRIRLWFAKKHIKYVVDFTENGYVVCTLTYKTVKESLYLLSIEETFINVENKKDKSKRNRGVLNDQEN